LATGSDVQPELIGISSKSYISGPTTQPSKLSKRAGLAGPKKFPKDVRNRSSNAVERNKLQHEVVSYDWLFCRILFNKFLKNSPIMCPTPLAIYRIVLAILFI